MNFFAPVKFFAPLRGAPLTLVMGFDRINYMDRNINRNIKRTNPYSGQSEVLTWKEAYWYDAAKRAEVQEEYEVLQHCLDRFSRLNARAYMTLLD